MTPRDIPGASVTPASERPPGNRPEDGGRLTLCALASGSKGNAVYISDGESAILVDAGLSGVEIERRLKARKLSPRAVKAILVSHEHGDHIQGVGVLSRRFALPVYMNRKTRQAAGSRLGKISAVREYACGTGFTVGRLRVHPFAISHDAEDPAGFIVSRNGLKIGIATDLGVATALVKQHLKGCRALVLEANHDPEMLINGPYSWPLKQRVKSRTGHLSNEESRVLLNEIQHDRLSHVILAHLSETNNTPEKALSAVSLGVTHPGVRFSVATQDRCGALFDIV